MKLIIIVANVVSCLIGNEVEKMSKVIAIIDRPENCQKCWFSMCYYSLPLSTRRKGYSCRLKAEKVVEDFDYDAEVHLQNCPLKPIPEKKGYFNRIFDNVNAYNKGYDDCIDEIAESMKGGKW